MVNLGVLYANGNTEVENDIAKARDLFINAEALGNENAMLVCMWVHVVCTCVPHTYIYIWPHIVHVLDMYM